MIKVLFVCLGNICRSPMAEAVFRNLVKNEGLEDKIMVDSAGTGDWHAGNHPHDGTLKILKNYDISAENLFARQITSADFLNFDYIVVMDDNNMDDVLEFGSITGRNHIGKLCDYIPNATYDNVPDPYYTGDFNETYELVTAGCKGLMRLIKEEQDGI